jgi:lantibiotic leader peptide-processing serine protease
MVQPTNPGPTLCLLRLLPLFVFLAHVSSAQSLTGQERSGPIGLPVPHRYLVVYRSGAVPGDGEGNARLAGARVLRPQPAFGVLSLDTSGSADEAATVAALRAQPDVEFVVHDRMISADTLILRRPVAATISILPPPPPPPTPAPAAPSDTYYAGAQGWAVRQAGGYGGNVPGGPASGPWDTTMGAGVRIAILDSGVDQGHPDISPNLVFNLSEVDQAASTGMPSPCDDASPQDQQGHGTWTASLAAGAMGPGTGLTIGVAPSATLLNIKVLQRLPDPSSSAPDVATQCATGQASGLLSWTIQGIADAIAQRAQVISISAGTLVDLDTGEGAGLKAIFNRATYAASQAGAVVIASAGNDGVDLSNPRYMELPAQARGVLAVVASTNPECAENLTPAVAGVGPVCVPGPITLPYYSNFGAPLNAIAAPGGSYPEGLLPDPNIAVSGWIRGACSNGLAKTVDGPPSDPAHSFGCFNLGHVGYVQAMGTSASAPLAAGAAALLIASHPAWTPAQVIAALRSTATVAPTLPAAPEIDTAAAMKQF